MKCQVLILVIFAAVAFAHQLTIRNNCGFTVWPGLAGVPGRGTPKSGGFQLNSKASTTFTVTNGWGGIVWGRTGCNSNGQCTTGSCGKIQCNGSTGNGPKTVAEFQLDANGGLDFYDVNNVDGFNLPISVRPISGYKLSKKGPANRDCKTAGCLKNLNTNCPSGSAVKSGGKTVACKNNNAFFKKNCPNDFVKVGRFDTTVIFACAQNPSTNYEIVFCP